VNKSAVIARPNSSSTYQLAATGYTSRAASSSQQDTRDLPSTLSLENTQIQLKSVSSLVLRGVPEESVLEMVFLDTVDHLVLRRQRFNNSSAPDRGFQTKGIAAAYLHTCFIWHPRDEEQLGPLRAIGRVVLKE
jgi:hypothetical protein